jgi:hypothetical protein
MAAYILCTTGDYAPKTRKAIFDHLYGWDIKTNALNAQSAEHRKIQRDHPDAKAPKRHYDWDRITAVPLSPQDQFTWNSIVQRIAQFLVTQQQLGNQMQAAPVRPTRPPPAQQTQQAFGPPRPQTQTGVFQQGWAPPPQQTQAAPFQQGFALQFQQTQTAPARQAWPPAAQQAQRPPADDQQQSLLGSWAQGPVLQPGYASLEEQEEDQMGWNDEMDEDDHGDGHGDDDGEEEEEEEEEMEDEASYDDPDMLIHMIDVIKFAGGYFWRPHAYFTTEQRDRERARHQTILPVRLYVGPNEFHNVTLCVSATCSTCMGKEGIDWLGDQELRWLNTRMNLPPHYWEIFGDVPMSILTDAERKLMDREAAQAGLRAMRRQLG